MCVILDANVVREVFKAGDRHEPAREFFSPVNHRSFPLVAGGKVLRELLGASKEFREWWPEAVRSGKARKVNDACVDTMAQRVKKEGKHVSNDPHVLALARISGARLLYTNDKDLQKDFKKLTTNPSGRIYTTLEDRKNRNRNSNVLRPSHKKLLKRRDLCVAESPVSEALNRRRDVGDRHQPPEFRAFPCPDADLRIEAGGLSGE